MNLRLLVEQFELQTTYTVSKNIFYLMARDGHLVEFSTRK